MTALLSTRDSAASAEIVPAHACRDRLPLPTLRNRLGRQLRPAFCRGKERQSLDSRSRRLIISAPFLMSLTLSARPPWMIPRVIKACWDWPFTRTTGLTVASSSITPTLRARRACAKSRAAIRRIRSQPWAAGLSAAMSIVAGRFQIYRASTFLEIGAADAYSPLGGMLTWSGIGPRSCKNKFRSAALAKTSPVKSTSSPMAERSSGLTRPHRGARPIPLAIRWRACA